MKTEQELREQFELKRKEDDLSTVLLCGQKAYWNKTVQRDWEMFKDGYSLAQETIKAKDAEIERLLDQQAKDSYKERAGIFDKTIENKDKAIAEARELLSDLRFERLMDDCRCEHCRYLEKAKAWLENNK